MNVLVYLVPLAVTLGALGLAAFLWAPKNGQFDDLDGAPWRAISDDDLPEDKRWSAGKEQQQERLAPPRRCLGRGGSRG
jgi:cbb3-type cytochrome oxidase maturation protein